MCWCFLSNDSEFSVCEMCFYVFESVFCVN